MIVGDEAPFRNGAIVS